MIGPNNSGKSSFLANVQNLSDAGLILDSYEPKGLTEEQIHSYLDAIDNYSVPAPGGGSWNYNCWDEAIGVIRSNSDFVTNAFLVRKWKASTIILDGKTRLSIVDDRLYQGIATEKAKNEFEILRSDRSLKAKLQDHLEVILPGKFFALWNPEPTKLRAFICDIEPKSDIEYFDSPEAKTFFETNARPLTSYSDGIKAYLGILISIIAGGKQHFLIDEPEAFLHPNLCFKLGQTLAQISSDSDNICFCATHSPYFLKGCLSQTPNKVSVTRFEYENGMSSTKTLEADDILAVIHDPLLNNIGVTEGLFHSRVVITEGDSDRAFYTEINNRLLANGSHGIRDCIFINAQNKQTIAKVLALFRKVSIPCAAISDIDTFKEGGTIFSNILNALSIPTGTAKSLAVLRERVNQLLKEAVDKLDKEAEYAEVSYESIELELQSARTSGKDARAFLSMLRGKTKPPDYKRLGGLNLLSGEELQDGKNLSRQLEHYGWFILHSGEVEHWLMHLNVGISKQGWLLRIFGAMGSEPESPDYISPPEVLDDVWKFIESIASWFAAKNTSLNDHHSRMD